MRSIAIIFMPDGYFTHISSVWFLLHCNREVVLAYGDIEHWLMTIQYVDQSMHVSSLECIFPFGK